MLEEVGHGAVQLALLEIHWEKNEYIATVEKKWKVKRFITMSRELESQQKGKIQV